MTHFLLVSMRYWRSTTGITFPRPTAPGPNYFFTAPNDGITFSRPPTSKITFSRPLVIAIVCHVFFYSFKQNSTYRLFENSFQQNVLSYTDQLQCESIGCFFIWCKLKVESLLIVFWMKVFLFIRFLPVSSCFPSFNSFLGVKSFLFMFIIYSYYNY